ncbi:hypothetical protein CANARDRAFT_28729 [[Candida] arabinofermentans NRRL YB-2248]|uniref:cysteine--tRNA ligase n=1 Tax=[Candida] arabinofermentans NRRL YB-2248 TaxID=983967 RepID=A0A1E4SZW9_9ASCO|nr:hypothetical protein CANARDRAFT_28729 [[Candida] arabinofermentans NRRL YB-2248]
MSSSSAPISNQQPTWIKPTTKTEQDEPVLKLYNTLTRSKVEFIPRDKNEVTWYSCGPTVYNSSHMGHARNYVTIDINRRILQDYFGYNVKFIQNVTDIDDKIILKARQEYLFDQFAQPFKKSGIISDDLVDKAQKGFNSYVSKNLPDFKEQTIETDFIKWTQSLDLKTLSITKPKYPMHIKASIAALTAINSKSTISVEEFLLKTQDVIVPLLDDELGSTVTDPEIFKNCSSFWERKFDEDMSQLNVLPSTVTTRVSEYVPEIVEFVSKIVDQGFAYATSDGSVYFNTSKFDQSANHDYAKCAPWSKGNKELIEDGEGSLSLSTTDTKLSSSDFALWKSSKPGEPSWTSPWGQGRPGWHIECSVMASDFVGDGMDIHSGGIDLAFPHHDNELAQSEAHFDCQQWVNYFLHTGHLHIEGQKMSKSLKNFITIEEALEKYSARQLRLCFALVQWNNSLDFKESLLHEVKSIESSLKRFFKNVRALKSDNDHKLSQGQVISKKCGDLEKKLFADILDTKKKVHAAFCDNLATPLAIRSLMDLVNSSNTYITSSGAELRLEPLLQSVYYVTKILKVLGFTTRSDSLGWSDDSTNTSESNNSGSIEDIVMPYMKVLSNFRDLVRNSAIKKEDYKVFLEATDTLRNKELLNLNVSLDDRSDGQGALIKFLNDEEKQELILQQEEKLQAQLEKERKKLEQLKLKEAKEKERLEKAKISPIDMFKTDEYRKLYSEWDETGMPVKNIEGEELAKSAKKKLAKLHDAQKKLHDEYLKSL